MPEGFASSLPDPLPAASFHVKHEPTDVLGNVLTTIVCNDKLLSCAVNVSRETFE